MSLLGSAALVGCDRGNSADVGEVNLALTLPNGVTVSSIGWTVLSSTSTVLASGTTNISNPSSTPSVSVGLPQGTGDTVTMTATTGQGVSCSGTSAPFNVVAGRVAAVSVTVVCGNAPAGPGLGSVVVTGVLVAGDNCPVLSSWVVSPQQTAAAGGSIDVSVSATDVDTGEVLTYAWTASAGSFANPASASTQYLCGAAGTETLTVTIWDNHTPTTCTVSVAFPPVTCL